MRFSVGTNFDPALAEGLGSVPEVEDVYAKLPVDLVGGGRPAYVIPKVGRDEATSHIQACHRQGIEFTYLLNASCLYGREFDASWRAAFDRLLDDLVEMGVDRVTVALPYLIGVVRERHPGLKVNVSSFAEVNSVERARRFARMGVNEITFDFLNVQRDFELMEAMVRGVDVRFQALANHTCLYMCPSRMHHANLSSHGSQCERREGGGATLDWCVLQCLEAKLSDPTELIKAPWIRPEDLWHYEEIGVHKFKLVDRARSTEWILRVVRAYAARRTPDGDLIDVLNAMGSGGLPFADFEEFLRADAVRPELADTLGGLAQHRFLTIDNAELEGFLDKVKQVDCRTQNCETCGVCAEVASRAVKLNPRLPPEVAARFDDIRDGLGSFLREVTRGSAYKDPVGAP